MKPQPAPARIPETMGPEEIGPYLRSLREQFKLTPQDVSERLHIRVRYVNAIEDAKYENMPGKVYARGYVHTYSEFLGLDAEQVVAQCFPPATSSVASTPEAEKTPAAKAPAKIPAPQVAKPFVTPVMPVKPGNGRLIGMGGAALCAVLLGYFLFSGNASAPVEEESTVAPVPEEMLASVRSEIMPVARNYVCLTTSNILSCILAQNTVQQLQQLEEAALHPFIEDLAGVVVMDDDEIAARKQEEEKAADQTAEEKSADSKAVETKTPASKPAEVNPATEANTHESQ